MCGDVRRYANFRICGIISAYAILKTQLYVEKYATCAIVCSHINGIPITVQVYSVHCWPRKYSVSRFKSADTLRPYNTIQVDLTPVWRASDILRVSSNAQNPERIYTTSFTYRKIVPTAEEAIIFKSKIWFLAHSKNELIQWRGVRRLSVCQSVRLSVRL